MVMFHSYVSLPEGNTIIVFIKTILVNISVIIITVNINIIKLCIAINMIIVIIIFNTRGYIPLISHWITIKSH